MGFFLPHLNGTMPWQCQEFGTQNHPVTGSSSPCIPTSKALVAADLLSRVRSTPKKTRVSSWEWYEPWSILTIWLMVIPSIIFGSKNNGYYKSLWTIGWLKRWILVETIDGDSFHGKWYVDPSIWKIIWEWYKDRKKNTKYIQIYGFGYSSKNWMVIKSEVS